MEKEPQTYEDYLQAFGKLRGKLKKALAREERELAKLKAVKKDLTAFKKKLKRKLSKRR
ncbi:MAG: hypothetical protein JW869_03710 [Candidatus Omnitrophica bacterium]|nr:hypothetical protein [Candidatus Omnitrophota bacterium]